MFVVNAALLTLTSLIMQSVSMAFNIYISKKVGAEGIGLFTLIMSVNGLCVTFATSGVHLASVRLVSEALGQNSPKQVRAAMSRCIIYALLFSVATSLCVQISAEYIGNVWLADVRTVRCIRILALSLPFISVSSAMAGYFSAVRRVAKSASMQIFDEIVTITMVSIGLKLLIPKGTEFACIAIIGGTCIAEMLSFLYMLIMYITDIRHCNPNTGSVSPRLTNQMLSITLPVAFTAYAKSGLSTIKNLLIPYGLKKNGKNSTSALEAYGMLSGMAMPIVMFPQVIIASFSGLLVPEITKSRVMEHYNNIRYIISRVLHVVMLFSIGVCGILIAFAFDFGELIYSNNKVSLYIMLMAPLIPFLYTDSIVDATLNGLDEQVHSMKINLIDSMISICLVWFLLPKMGTYGYILMMYICKLINAALSFIRLIKVTKLKIQLKKWIIKPAVCISVSVLLTMFLSNILHINEHLNIFTLVFKVSFSASIYFILARITGCIDNYDWSWFKELIKDK